MMIMLLLLLLLLLFIIIITKELYESTNIYLKAKNNINDVLKMKKIPSWDIEQE